MPSKRKQFVNHGRHSCLTEARRPIRCLHGRTHAMAVPKVDEPIDPSVVATLRALQREGRPDILGALVRLFLEKTGPMLRDLEMAAEAGDFDLLHRLCHALTSASANMGARILATRCKELGQLARAGAVVAPTTQVKVICAEFQRAEAALLAYAAPAADMPTHLSA
jgi:HPt (histidine-containing phosphotransfer) domain-containing protein